jgi:ferredoxin
MSARALPAVNPAQCTGCGRCVAACPPKVLWLQAPHPKGWGPKVSTLHDPDACTGCAKCHVVCPFDAIRMVRLSEPRTPS